MELLTDQYKGIFEDFQDKKKKKKRFVGNISILERDFVWEKGINLNRSKLSSSVNW